MNRYLSSFALVLWLGSLGPAHSQEPASASQTPHELFAAVLAKVAAVVEPIQRTAPCTWSGTIQISAVEGLDSGLVGQQFELAYQAPDRCRLEAAVAGRRLLLGRDGQELWVYAPEKHFGILGQPGRARFASAPGRKDATRLEPIRLPLPREQLLLLPLLMKVEGLGEDIVVGKPCRGLRVSPLPQAVEALRIPKGELTLWLQETDGWPCRVQVKSEQGQSLQLDLRDVKEEAAWPGERWQPPVAPGDTVEPVALGHVTRFLSAGLSLLNQRIPTLGPAEGRRKVLATEGAGRLEDRDGTKVLFLKGSPEAMGRQHGVLMKRQVRDLVKKVLYGVGVGSSFEKGRWFLGEIEAAQKRLMPHIDERYLGEMDALAVAAGLATEEVRLANFFPELFHCSGFALFGTATEDGRLFHGRILDYLKGVGLEPNAVVIVHQPAAGYAWANVSYAGFVGTVTAMNEKRVSIGEMGGRGEGNWDGKPMAQLLREVMENADTLDRAIDILRHGPRTCEYYYVVADGNNRRAVGVAATPTTFELVWPGQTHPRLPHAIPDAVVLSAGDRYETLVERVLAQHGKFRAASARRLMERPVAMKSNIHSVLFAPETLDFWVANADSENVASHTRYTHYNLGDLLKSRAIPAGVARPPANLRAEPAP